MSQPQSQRVAAVLANQHGASGDVYAHSKNTDLVFVRSGAKAHSNYCSRRDRPWVKGSLARRLHPNLCLSAEFGDSFLFSALRRLEAF